MNFLEKLDYLMNVNNINKHILAKESGIPYTTIDAFYKKGYTNAKLSTVKKLCSYFNVSLDYMMKDDDINDIKNLNNLDEQKLIDIFRKLNEPGQKKITEYAEDLLNNAKYSC